MVAVSKEKSNMTESDGRDRKTPRIGRSADRFYGIIRSIPTDKGYLYDKLGQDN